MKRVVIKVFGQVQGVLYRHSARNFAERLGLAGWAKNEEGGSVAIVAEGEEKALGDFAEWCKKGPMLASVDEVKIEWQNATGKFKRFEIL